MVRLKRVKTVETECEGCGVRLDVPKDSMLEGWYCRDCMQAVSEEDGE